MSGKNLIIYRILGVIFLIINTFVLIICVETLFSYYFCHDRLYLIRFPVYILCIEIVMSIIGIILSILIMRKNCRYRITKVAIMLSAPLIINFLIFYKWMF